VWVSDLWKSCWRKFPVMMCYKQSNEHSDMWKDRKFLITWKTDSNSRIFRSLYLYVQSKFSAMFRWFVKTEMTYIQHFSFRFCKYYQSTLNGLKDVKCRRTCGVLSCASECSIPYWPWDYSLLELSLVNVEKLLSKKPVPVAELACFVSSLLN